MGRLEGASEREIGGGGGAGQRGRAGGGSQENLFTATRHIGRAYAEVLKGRRENEESTNRRRSCGAFDVNGHVFPVDASHPSDTRHSTPSGAIPTHSEAIHNLRLSLQRESALLWR